MKCKTCGEMNCMAHGGMAKKPLPMPKSMMAKGGEEDMPEVKSMKMDEPEGKDMDDADDELNDMVAGELMDALEKKDKKGVLDSIRALVMNCGGKV